MHEHDAPDPHLPIEEDAELTYYEQRVEAVQALLIEKGLLSADDVRRAVEDMDARSPAVGARVIARAWVDPHFKQHLLADAKAAIATLGIDVDTWSTLVAVENTRLFIMSWCVPCAPAIPALSSVCRPTGIKVSITGLGW